MMPEGKIYTLKVIGLFETIHVFYGVSIHIGTLVRDFYCTYIYVYNNGDVPLHPFASSQLVRLHLDSN